MTVLSAVESEQVLMLSQLAMERTPPGWVEGSGWAARAGRLVVEKKLLPALYRLLCCQLEPQPKFQQGLAAEGCAGKGKAPRQLAGLEMGPSLIRLSHLRKKRLQKWWLL
jgi:hypothetical protein